MSFLFVVVANIMQKNRINKLSIYMSASRGIQCQQGTQKKKKKKNNRIGQNFERRRSVCVHEPMWVSK